MKPFPLETRQTCCSKQNISTPTPPTHKNNRLKATTAKPPKAVGAKLVAPPTNGFGLVVVIGKPELAAIPVPPMVPLKYPVDVLVAVIVDVELVVVVVVPVGATAGRPLTGLTSKRLLNDGLTAAGIALKRTLGTTAVDSAVDEALSTTVLMTVFWTVL